MHTHRILSSALVGLTFLTAAAAADATGRPHGRWQPRAALEGTWQVAVTPVNCATGEEFPQFTLLSLLTFHAGGTMAETTSNRNFQPGQRSPGYGYWQYTGRRTYRAYFEAFIQFDSVDPIPPTPAYQRGVQSIDQSIEMQDVDHWTSDGLVRFRNMAGEMVPPSGCAKARAKRMP